LKLRQVQEPSEAVTSILAELCAKIAWFWTADHQSLSEANDANSQLLDY
jgi:hypothetical protein